MINDAAKFELFYKCICENDEIKKVLFGIDANRFIGHEAVKLVEKIRRIVQNPYYDDAQLIIELIKTLEEFNIDCGHRSTKSKALTIR